MSTQNEKVILWYRRNVNDEYEKIRIDKKSLTATRIGELFGLAPKSIQLRENTASSDSGVDVVFADNVDDNALLVVECNGPYIINGTSAADQASMKTNNATERTNATAASPAAVDHDRIPMLEEVDQAALEQIKAKVKELTGESFEHINISLVGKTGSGKSTLINALFGCDLAKEGVGKPMTMEINEYPRRCDVLKGPYRHLRLFDTRGIEIGNAQETVEKVKAFLRNKNGNNTNMRNHIHFALYTVLASGMRLEEVEIELIKMIKNQGIGVIIVMTKATDDMENMKRFEESINRDCPRVNVIQVLAKKMVAERYQIEAFGLNKLVELIHGKIPEQCRTAFVAAQTVDRRLKAKRAQEMVGWLTAGAGVATVVPTGGLLLKTFLSLFSATIGNVFDVDNKSGWDSVVIESGVCESVAGVLSNVPIVGAVSGVIAASNYFAKLISALEQLHHDRHGEMQGVTLIEMTEAIRNV